MTVIVNAIIILVLYTIILCVVNKQIPNSLSASVFALPPSGSWLWTVVIGGVSFMTMPTLIKVTPDTWRFLAFISCAGLAFVAVCPLIPDKTDLTYKIHMAGAITCAVASQLLVAIVKWWLLLGWLPWIIAFIWITKDHSRWRTQVFWAEMTCFAISFGYCMLNLIGF